MDHRVAKDMISSGMIPSGEKKKEDLSRTQYGSAPSPNALLDAYKSMYDKKEEVINEHHKKDADGNTIPHEHEEELNEGKIPAGLQAYLDKKKGKKEDKKDMKEQYDLVYEHFIGEGFSEEETLEKMLNLTEEQLDEFMKALATRAAKYGASLGGNTPAPKMGPPRPNAKPGQTGFKASSPSQVVADVNARKKEASAFKAKPLRDKMDSALTKLRTGNLKFGSTSKNEDQKEEYVKEGIGMAAKAALGLVKNIAKKETVKKLAGNVATGAAMSAGSNLMSGGGGGQQKQKTGTVSASADLFDIVKGQLLDEGLSEEEIRDIMLTLTPDEILNEISAETALAASKGRDQQASMLKGSENTEKRAELRAKASQNYNRSVEKRKAGFVKNTASPQGPSRIPTNEEKKPLPKTKMYRKAGNLSRKALSKGLDSKEGSKAQKRSEKIVSTISTADEKKRFDNMKTKKSELYNDTTGKFRKEWEALKLIETENYREQFDKWLDGIVEEGYDIERWSDEELVDTFINENNLWASREAVDSALLESDKKGKGSGKKDACYHKVKASASVWPSAYASGRLVQCRKKGAANYGNSSKKEDFSDWKSDIQLDEKLEKGTKGEIGFRSGGQFKDTGEKTKDGSKVVKYVQSMTTDKVTVNNPPTKKSIKAGTPKARKRAQTPYGKAVGALMKHKSQQWDAERKTKDARKKGDTKEADKQWNKARSAEDKRKKQSGTLFDKTGDFHDRADND